MISILDFSLFCFLDRGAMRSRVMVEAEVMAREDRVDMEAASTRISTRPMSQAPPFPRSASTLFSMAGMMASKEAGLPAAFSSTLSA